jgi:N-acetylmuramic acid 6-phosphate etherase
MSELPRTEQRNPRSMRLGEMTAIEAIALMTDEEEQALVAVREASETLAVAAEHVAAAFAGGGTVVLLGSGTSGRLAIQEVAELPPTFGVPASSFVALAAGGPSTGPAAITRSEDDVDAAPRALAALGIGEGDAVIGVAASGTTPFVQAGLTAARSRGAWTCGIASNPETPVLRSADLAVLLDTGPEVLTGSTRLKAGTAQKLALNRITTAAMVRCGRVVENHMVDVVVTIDKLRGRAARIVADLGGVSREEAARLLEEHGWAVRPALAALRGDGSRPAKPSR